MNVNDFLNSFVTTDNDAFDSYEIINDSLLDNAKYESSSLLTKRASERKIDSMYVEQLRTIAVR